MKSVYLVRHAKSSWEDASLTDFDRPLNKRGLRDGPVMASRLSKQIPTLEGMVCSAAKRALATGYFFQQSLGIAPSQQRVSEQLYHASIATWMAEIATLPTAWQAVLMVGHNPGITALANLLGNYPVENIPTTGIYALGFKVASWTAFSYPEAPPPGELLFYDYPKNQGFPITLHQ